jgi:MarR family transcriptional regulator, temperature-dependent positive regulator of motility
MRACSTVERTPFTMTDEIRYRLLRHLEQHSDASQRELARALGISVGKTNYCLRALVKKGLVKMRNFRRSDNKLAYAYVLTPKGIEEKVNVTSAFLKVKMAEYDNVLAEIERLSREVEESNKGNKTVASM